jgi:hypothetical protein
MKCVTPSLRIALAVILLFLPSFSFVGVAWTKVDCSPTANSSNDLPRTVAIASNLAGVGLVGGGEQEDAGRC